MSPTIPDDSKSTNASKGCNERQRSKCHSPDLNVLMQLYVCVMSGRVSQIEKTMKHACWTRFYFVGIQHSAHTTIDAPPTIFSHQITQSVTYQLVVLLKLQPPKIVPPTHLTLIHNSNDLLVLPITLKIIILHK